MSIADNLVKSSAKNNIVDSKELSILIEKLKNKTLKIEDLVSTTSVTKKNKPSSKNDKTTSSSQKNLQHKTYIADKVINTMNKNTPQLAFELIPKDILTFTCNDLMTRSSSVQDLLKNLPKTSDGKYDVKEIRKILSKSSQIIKFENNKALDLMEYGIYKENINNLDMLAVLLGPEVNHLLKQAGLLKPINVGSVMDADLLSILRHFVDNGTEVAKILDSQLVIKNSVKIKENISKQNAALDKLCSMKLDTQEDIINMLTEYKKITGTSFMYSEIEKTLSSLNNKSLTKKQRLDSYVKNFGIPTNLIDAKKNNIYTNAVYEAIFKYVIPKIITNCVPFGKFFGPFIPAGVETAETLTKGAKNKIINTDNVTTHEFSRISVDGVIHALVVGDKFSWPLGKKILTEIPQVVKKLNLSFPYRLARTGIRTGTTKMATDSTENIINTMLPKDKNNRLKLLLSMLLAGGDITSAAALLKISTSIKK